MVNYITKSELEAAINATKAYVASVYSPKTTGYYHSTLEKLWMYSKRSTDSPEKDIPLFYELITRTPAYERPETSWLRIQARALLMLIDVINGQEPQREYYYKRYIYNGIFFNELEIYRDWRISNCMSEQTLRKEIRIITNFLLFLEEKGIKCLSCVNGENLLEFLQSIDPCYSDQWIRSHAYTVRKFLSCPDLSLTFDFDITPLLSGFRHNKNTRLESYYSVDEIKAVMNAVERDTPWGKTIYVMMLLACVYGLRVSDIRGLSISSIHWKNRTISLYQVKTKRFVELPLIDEVAFAILDYMKNVRPESDDPHVFLRHLAPHIPYSTKDNFGSKVSHYFRKAGVNTTGKHHGLHAMRHSLATNLLAENTATNEIAAILGHSTVKSTKAYIWSDIKHLRLAALEVPSYGK